MSHAKDKKLRHHLREVDEHAEILAQVLGGGGQRDLRDDGEGIPAGADAQRGNGRDLGQPVEVGNGSRHLDDVADGSRWEVGAGGGEIDEDAVGGRHVRVSLRLWERSRLAGLSWKLASMRKSRNAARYAFCRGEHKILPYPA